MDTSKVLAPFVLALSLSLSRIHRFEGQVRDLVIMENSGPSCFKFMFYLYQQINLNKLCKVTLFFHVWFAFFSRYLICWKQLLWKASRTVTNRDSLTGCGRWFLISVKYRTMFFLQYRTGRYLRSTRFKNTAHHNGSDLNHILSRFD